MATRLGSHSGGAILLLLEEHVSFVLSPENGTSILNTQQKEQEKTHLIPKNRVLFPVPFIKGE